MTRNINYIVVHCSAGNMKNTAADIVSYHTRPILKGGRGWRVPGYHYIIEADGKVTNTVPVDRVSNGVVGYNSCSINVCYVGGVNQKDLKTPEDTRTPAQKEALETLLAKLAKMYPGAKILGHRDLARKACPSFDAKAEYAHLNVPRK